MNTKYLPFTPASSQFHEHEGANITTDTNKITRPSLFISLAETAV